eukprot:TRINITY_DN6775_c0_g1_i1.p2 TRINITY_DN6775_c0_g1~~TRINITY_DN6775_c0_g1_i1.p2  ORF type:complete len:105 (+),score=34.15 TRINITY_DN6775_c0_g1_i1:197-511(+)
MASITGRYTPLSFAAQNGHTEVVRELLGAGAEVDKAAENGATPLSFAAQNGHTEVVKELLGAGAEVDNLSLIHISEPTRLLSISYAVFCLKKKKTYTQHTTRIR